MAKRERRPTRPRQPIGWREWVGLPDLGVRAIKAKIDTGARTSALHAFRLRTVRRNGQELARFIVYPMQRSHDGAVEVEAEVIDHRRVRSSNGVVQVRPVIRSTMAIGEESWAIDLTLTGRDEMGFRMLVGRAAMRGRYLVDPARSYVTGRPVTPPPDGQRRRRD